MGQDNLYISRESVLASDAKQNSLLSFYFGNGSWDLCKGSSLSRTDLIHCSLHTHLRDGTFLQRSGQRDVWCPPQLLPGNLMD